MRAAELIGPALDWAVAKCEGLALDFHGTGNSAFLTADQIVVMADWDDAAEWNPSNDWAQGGPIIGREIIERGLLLGSRLGKCEAAYTGLPEWYTCYGPTPLIAAMRCYVASKSGDGVGIPKELL